jgi:putative nucleotidyltransferase with HDIG domain
MKSSTSTAISLDQVTDRIKDLPTLPAIVMELLSSLENENLDTHMLAQKVTQDTALTAKTLRYANSAYYATQVKVTTIPQAISMLGLTTVKHLVMSAALSGCFPVNNCQGFNHKAFWKHSNAVASISKQIAKHLNFNLDVAYTAGLLHDLGCLVIVSLFPLSYSEVILCRQKEGLSLVDAEEKILGFNHAAVGEALAEVWNFSNVIKNALGHHHSPNTPGVGFLPTIIYLANTIAQHLEMPIISIDEVIELNKTDFQVLNLDDAALEKLLNTCREDLKKIQEVDL